MKLTLPNIGQSWYYPHWYDVVKFTENTLEKTQYSVKILDQGASSYYKANWITKLTFEDFLLGFKKIIKKKE